MTVIRIHDTDEEPIYCDQCRKERKRTLAQFEVAEMVVCAEHVPEEPLDQVQPRRTFPRRSRRKYARRPSGGNRKSRSWRSTTYRIRSALVTRHISRRSRSHEKAGVALVR
jgi:hypothetical protein